MSDDFRKEPLLVIYRELAEIEAQTLAEETALRTAREANQKQLEKVRALQDLIRPTIVEDGT